MQGVPMIANSPVRQNSPLNMHGIDVVPYQPPWKALSEFALYANLENNDNVINQHNPAFRRLVNQVRMHAKWLKTNASKVFVNKKHHLCFSLRPRCTAMTLDRTIDRHRRRRNKRKRCRANRHRYHRHRTTAVASLRPVIT